MFDYRTMGVAGIACITGLLAGTVQAGPYTVTDPTDIWVDGNPANGKDVIDPAGGVSVTYDVGNYDSATFNANPDRFVFGMDTAEFATGWDESNAGNRPEAIILTEGVSGVDLTVNIGSGVLLLQANPPEATSPDNVLGLAANSFNNLNFDRAVDAAGFVISNVKGGVRWDVSFYSDLDGETLLASHTIEDTGGDDNVFVGHFDDVNGIRRIDAVRTGGANGGFIDDIAVVVPEPTSASLLAGAVIGLLTFRRRRSQ